ncbi:hypothetical protein M3M39_04870 [Fructilactobacillus hinvesii]|uniref:Uncharacterized protein n=1 Tax=Fructilactobacillus hinvesii TaxID=2940300 RepID=A0ABY5BTY5_9LACO|nr:hypothetical protein [Fructilactobacillus hinvesii]USS87456.1 hypothetical protein M3M39_04870 [Fructilactobacillus hinvesii]
MEKDFSHIDPVDPNNTSLVYGNMATFISQWRSKMYGSDVREAGARCWENLTVEMVQFAALQHKLEKRTTDLEHRFDNALNSLMQDAEVKDARINGNGEVYPTLKSRLDHDFDNSGKIGMGIGSDSFDNTALFVKNVDSKTDKFFTKLTGTNGLHKMPVGIETIDLADLDFK